MIVLNIFRKSNEPIIIKNKNFKQCILFISFPIKDNDLVYRCGVYCYSIFGTLTLWAITGRDNIDNVKINFEKVMKEIINIDFIKEKLELLLKEFKLDDDLIKENIYSILMLDVDKYIECKEETLYQLTEDIAPKEVKGFIENILIFSSKFIGMGKKMNDLKFITLDNDLTILIYSDKKKITNHV